MARILVLAVAMLAAGALAISPATAGKFLTKKKALKTFVSIGASSIVSTDPTPDISLTGADMTVLTTDVTLPVGQSLMATANADLLMGAPSGAAQAYCFLTVDGAQASTFAFAEFPISSGYNVEVPVVGGASAAKGSHNVVLVCHEGFGIVEFDRANLLAWAA